MATTDSGILRISVKHLGVSRDADNDKPQLSASLEFAWEPRFQPFLLAIEELNVEYAPDAKDNKLKAAMKGGGTKIRVTGRNAFADVVRLEAPERSSPAITSLKGKIRLIGPVEMQTLMVSPLPLPNEAVVPEQDKKAFQVTVNPVKNPKNSKWLIPVDIVPKEPLRMFESHHQYEWLENNRAHLDSLKKKSLRVQASSRFVGGTPGVHEGRRVFYEFDMSGSLAKTTPADWKLTIVTPGRIVDFVVPFEFKDLKLP
jgi:hypothetical protein